MLRSGSRFDELSETAKIPRGDELCKTAKNRGEYTFSYSSSVCQLTVRVGHADINHMEPEHAEAIARVVCRQYNFYLCEISGLITEEKYHPR